MGSCNALTEKVSSHIIALGLYPFGKYFFSPDNKEKHTLNFTLG